MSLHVSYEDKYHVKAMRMMHPNIYGGESVKKRLLLALLAVVLVVSLAAFAACAKEEEPPEEEEVWQWPERIVIPVSSTSSPLYGSQIAWSTPLSKRPEWWYESLAKPIFLYKR